MDLTNTEAWRLKVRYIKDIKEMCFTAKGRPLNVALIGCVGVGKSSLINSIAAALSRNRWREYAYTGMRGTTGDPVTTFTNRHPRCCLPESVENEKLPTLLDIAGFPQIMDRAWERVLQMLFYGRIPEGENLTEVHDYIIRQQNEPSIIPKYFRTFDHLRVHRIIVVCSASEPVQTEFLNSVLRTARPYEDHATRTIPIFCAITKADTVDVTGDRKIKERQLEMINCLGLRGSEHRFVSCINYCGAVDPDNDRTRRTFPGLDVPILEFLYQVFDPAIRVVNNDDNFPLHVFQQFWVAIVIFLIAVITFIFILQTAFAVT